MVCAMGWLKNTLLVLSFFHCSVGFANQAKLYRIKVGSHHLAVELAKTETERQQGLMNRFKWGKTQGMLFVFSDSQRRRFWMKNTFLDLSLGFFNKDKKLVEMHDLRPVRSISQVKIDSVVSREEAKYVLEVPKGWFDKYKIGLGTYLEVLE